MKFRLLLALCAGFFLSGAMAESADTGQGKMMLEAAQARLMVAAINHETREVTLQNDAGEQKSFVIGKEARNLDQVKAGDVVTIKTAQAVAMAVYPVASGSQGRVEKTSVSRSELGQKPHMTLSREVELTGKLVKLDKKSRIATIQGKHADITLEAAADVDLETVNVGDTVKVNYLEMISITVDSPSK